MKTQGVSFFRGNGWQREGHFRIQLGLKKGPINTNTFPRLSVHDLFFFFFLLATHLNSSKLP